MAKDETSKAAPASAKATAIAFAAMFFVALTAAIVYALAR